MNDLSREQAALARVLAYAEARDYAGFSKFDALNSPLLNALSLNFNPLRWAIAQAVYRFPLNVRPLLGVRQGRNPKGIGLFALAYLLQAQDDPPHAESHINKARALLDWLEAHQAAGYHGACWGYNHPWPNFRFSAPANFPNLVVTGNIVIALLTAYEQLGEERYLAIARSSLEFIRRDLNTLRDTATERAISYIPGSHWIVLNNQGLAATLLAWMARHTGEDDLREMARRHIHFLAAQQTDEGAWFYAYPPESSPVTHDNYHTGNVLDWLLLYGVYSGDETYRPAFARGLDFYRERLFLPDGAPKHRHNRTYPHDIHGSAQGAITFARAALHHDPACLADARRILTWALDHMQAPDGHYYYQRGRFWINTTPLMRWNQGWMAAALAYIIRVSHVLTAQPLGTP